MKQLFESSRLVWARIPKKGLFSLFSFVAGYIANLVLDSFFRNEAFKFPEQWQSPLVGGAIFLGAYFLISFVFFSLKVIAELRAEMIATSPEMLVRLADRFEAHSRVLQVVEAVPHNLDRQQMVARYAQDGESRRNLSGRLARLFGLRNELIAFLDPELVNFIDKTFRPLYMSGEGKCQLISEKADLFAEAAYDLRILVQRVESNLFAEREKLAK